MKKKGAGARRAVCGVQMPRVFQTAIDALNLVLSVSLWGKLPVVFGTMLDCSVGENEERREKRKKRGNIIKEGIMNGRMDLIADGLGGPTCTAPPPLSRTFVPRM